MKRFLAILTAGMTALSICSCHKHDREDPKPEVMPTSYDTFTDAGAYYYGTWEGVNIFTTYLLTGQTRIDNGVISGIGTALVIDLNSEIRLDATIKPGVYGPARNEKESGAFLRGMFGEDDKISGTYVYYRSLSGRAEYRLIKNGEITINLDGKKARISATVIDEDGVTFRFDYQGWFGYTDVVPDEPDEPEQPDGIDYTLNNFTYGYYFDYGQDFGTDKSSDYRIWRIWLADDNFNLDDFSGNGKQLQIEVVTEAAATDITGNYRVNYDAFPTNWWDALVNGNAFWGYIDDEGNYCGTWLFPSQEENTWTGATSGSVNITKDGSNYTITFDFADRFLGNTFKGTYTGALQKKERKESPQMASRSGACKAEATQRARAMSRERRSITAKPVAE